MIGLARSSDVKPMACNIARAGARLGPAVIAALRFELPSFTLLLGRSASRSEEHTSELQSLRHLVCRLLLEKKKTKKNKQTNPKHLVKQHIMNYYSLSSI